MALKRATDSLVRILEKRDQQLLNFLERRQVLTGRVKGRNSDGTVILESDTSQCDLRSSIDRNPNENLIGVGGTPFSAIAYGLDVIWVERLVPRILAPNQTQNVIVEGRGFRDGIIFIFLLPTLEPHPLITVDSVTVNSSTEIELTVTVGAADPLVGAPLRYTY